MFGLAAAGIAVIADGPAAAVAPAGMVVKYHRVLPRAGQGRQPCGQRAAGHLIAATGSTGRWAAISLVVAAGLAVAIWLLIRPPAGVHTAGWCLAHRAGIAVPARAGRVSYFIYPLGLSAWLLLTRPVLHAAGS